MTTIWQWLVAHQALIVAVFGSTAFASAVSTFVNVYADPDHNPATPPPKWIVPFIILKNLLALRAGEGRKGIEGIGDGGWSVPLLHYPRVGVRVPSRNGVRPGSAGVLLFLIPALLLGCAHVKATLIDFGKCELGQVPSALAGVLSDVNKTLGGESPNWRSDMEAIGKKQGIDAVNCAVSAILHNLAAKKSALDEVGKRKNERGQIWLSGHRVAQ